MPYKEDSGENLEGYGNATKKDYHLLMTQAGVVQMGRSLIAGEQYV